MTRLLIPLRAALADVVLTLLMLWLWWVALFTDWAPLLMRDHVALIWGGLLVLLGIHLMRVIVLARHSPAPAPTSIPASVPTAPVAAAPRPVLAPATTVTSAPSPQASPRIVPASSTLPNLARPRGHRAPLSPVPLQALVGGLGARLDRLAPVAGDEVHLLTLPSGEKVVLRVVTRYPTFEALLAATDWRVPAHLRKLVQEHAAAEGIAWIRSGTFARNYRQGSTLFSGTEEQLRDYLGTPLPGRAALPALAPHEKDRALQGLMAQLPASWRWIAPPSDLGGDQFDAAIVHGTDFACLLVVLPELEAAEVRGRDLGLTVRGATFLDQTLVARLSETERRSGLPCAVWSCAGTPEMTLPLADNVALVSGNASFAAAQLETWRGQHAG